MMMNRRKPLCRTWHVLCAFELRGHPDVRQARPRRNSLHFSIPMLPSLILRTWALGLLAIGIIATGIRFAQEWTQRSWSWDPVQERPVFAPQFGFNEETAILAG